MCSQAAFERQKPAITGSRAGRRLVQRSDEKTQPELRRPSIRVREHKHFAARICRSHGHAEVVNLLSAVSCWSRDNCLNDWAGWLVELLASFFNDGKCGIVR